MIHLVTGGSASGKSAYAESLITEQKALERYYIATMQPWGEEGKKRVEKHRKMRESKHFTTVERYKNLSELCLDKRKAPSGRAVLLECVSNLTANEQFENGGTDEEIAERILSGIRRLYEQTDILVIVTNEVFSDGCSYEEETVRYIRLLGTVNLRLAELADRVTEVVYGIPVQRKP